MNVGLHFFGWDFLMHVNVHAMEKRKKVSKSPKPNGCLSKLMGGQSVEPLQGSRSNLFN